MQKESLLFFSFSSESTFDEIKGTNKRKQYKEKRFFLLIYACLIVPLHQ